MLCQQLGYQAEGHLDSSLRSSPNEKWLAEHLTLRSPKVLGREKPLSLADISQNKYRASRVGNLFIFLKLCIEREKSVYSQMKLLETLQTFSFRSPIVGSFLV